MTRQADSTFRIYATSVTIVLVSRYGVRLGTAWSAMLLLIVIVPMLMVEYQEKDAEGRPIPPGEAPRPGVYGELGIRYSQVGGKFAVSTGSALGGLLNLLHFEGWWRDVGVTSMPQELAVTSSLVAGAGFLFAYVCRRWPDEPREEKA